MTTKDIYNIRCTIAGDKWLVKDDQKMTEENDPAQIDDEAE